MGDFVKKTAVLWLLGAGFVTVLFQNCGSDVGFNETANSENPFGFGQTRKIELDPNNAENRPPIHLTSIYDNSTSTKQLQRDMSAGFTSAIGQLRGFNVNATLYTTSHDPTRANPSTEFTDLVSYTDANGNYVEIPADRIAEVPAGTPFTEKTVNRLAASWFLDRQPLVYNVGQDDFDAFRDYYANSVDALGEFGANEERGLCTLLKKIEQNRRFADPDNLAYHVYLLATNEDDQTTLDNCPIETRRETTFESTPTTRDCTSGEAGCDYRYDFRIAGNPSYNKTASISYTRTTAQVRLEGRGTRYEERYSYKRANASHAISFERQETSYTYTVLPKCFDDNTQVNCSLIGVSATTRTPNAVPGSCNISGTRACSGSTEFANAAAAMGIAVNNIDTCQISCSDRWVSGNLPSNQIPNRDRVCGSYSASSTNQAVQTHLGHNFFRNAQRTCNNNATNWIGVGSLSRNNEVTSCPANRDNNSSDKNLIASSVNGLPQSEIVESRYRCTVKTNRTHAITLTNKISCASGENETSYRNCSGTESQQLKDDKSDGSSFNESAAFQCRTTCSENNIPETVPNISTTGLTCPRGSTNSVSCVAAGRENEALADYRRFNSSGTFDEISNCQVSCRENEVAGQRCDLEDQTDGNLCNNPTQLTALCAAEGRNDINTASCQITDQGGSITENITTSTRGPATTVRIPDLEGVNETQNVSTMISQRLRTVHGNGFFASFFIHPSNDASCAPPANASEGTKYEALAQRLGQNNASTYPVCLSDYSPALDSVIKIAIDNVLNSFNLNIEDEEVVFEVKVINLDGTVDVVPESAYELFKKTITFKDKAVLKDAKTIEFAVWSPN